MRFFSAVMRPPLSRPVAGFVSRVFRGAGADHVGSAGQGAGEYDNEYNQSRDGTLETVFFFVKEGGSKDSDQTGAEGGGAIAEYTEQDVYGTYPLDRLVYGYIIRHRGGFDQYRSAGGCVDLGGGADYAEQALPTTVRP